MVCDLRAESVTIAIAVTAGAAEVDGRYYQRACAFLSSTSRTVTRRMAVKMVRDCGAGEVLEAETSSAPWCCSKNSSAPSIWSSPM